MPPAVVHMAAKRKTNTFKTPAGSPQSGEPEYLVIGKLRHPHGLRGEMLMEVITDFPERLQPGVRVYAGDERRPLQVRSIRSHAKGALIAFEGYDTPEAVGEFRNALVFTTTATLPKLPEGEYYHHQLIGLDVVTDEGQELGRLAEIMNTSANDIYIVRSEAGREILLPAIDPVILSIDLEQRKILVHLLPGI
jgi:16S rRNA processing protein RimM